MKTKKNNTVWSVIAVILFVVSMYINYGGQEISIIKGNNNYNSNNSSYEQLFLSYQNTDDAQAEDFSDHYYLAAKDRGDCRELKGDILITIILVDDSESVWTPEAAATFKADQDKATQRLESDAAGYGIELNVQMLYLNCAIEGTFSLQEYNDWVNSALDACGIPGPKWCSYSLKKEFGYKENPVLFAVNREGRSFAHLSLNRRGFEFAILYKNMHDYRHELYHIFGAEDYYYPKETKAAAQKYMSDSIMLDNRQDAVVDNLTAYSLGWVDCLSEDATGFLQETAWITPEYVKEAYEAQSKTGYHTMEWNGAVYTGQVVSGVPDGTGTMVWENQGKTFRGEFVYGQPTKGTYTYSDGTTRTIG